MKTILMAVRVPDDPYWTSKLIDQIRASQGYESAEVDLSADECDGIAGELFHCYLEGEQIGWPDKLRNAAEKIRGDA